ncbi:ParB/RepB/Spo0J family partition protein [Moraxella sp. Tifton1]|uniref:Probable chromosome-partitioning protein ParB n=1 Tax=Moraxella oculi TaxID=2940516 RepID=A0ABW8UBT6_9GAMM|nr:ParB/RepB/Spo0J family partition protein [Moraxella sp. Tifton1]MCL1623667.1 ParB/RepB/Spo0J family partition protein [Moraxella sp. Tifton1]
MKKRGLGARRGLDALMGNLKKERQIVSGEILPTTLDTAGIQQVSFDLLDDEGDVPSADTCKVKKPKKKSKNKQNDAKDDARDAERVALMQIGTERLQSGKYQPRRDMNEEALSELANSIRQHGIMQPIVIRPLLTDERKADGVITHEIIAGERRWRAAQMAGLTSVPAIERVLSDEIAIALALIENIQREDLNVLEQAVALQRFHTEFGMSHAMIADVVGKARATVSNLLRLNNLHDTVKGYMQEGLLDMGHARTLLALSTKQQPIIAKKIIDAKMTVRDAEKLVKSILNPESAKAKNTDAHEIRALNQKISDALGASVKIKQHKDGQGSIEIFFHGDDELQSLLSQFGVSC